MLNGLYSKQVYWPEGIQAVLDHVLSNKYVIFNTIHASDKIFYLGLPDRIYKAMLYGEVIEAEFHKGKLTKIVTRLKDKRSDSIDICAAILINPVDTYGNVAKVKTVWINDRDDNHKTINKEMYVCG